MNTRLVINGYELDLSENIAVPLNLSITDVKNPENRKRSFSKTLTLEGTTNNMQFFLSAYAIEMNIEQSSNIQYEPNKRYDCEFYKNDLLVFKGKFKLNHVTVNNGNYLFDCNLISDVVDIFTKLKDKKLGELDWSEYDHLLTRDNVINSWSQGIKLNDVDNRNFGSDAYGYQPKSYGYVYPLVDYGYVRPNNNQPENFRINQLYPFVYVREAVKKCLEYGLQGTNIEIDYSSFFWSEQNTNLTKLIYGFGGGEQLKLNDNQINDSKVLASDGISNTLYAAKNTGVYSFANQFNVLDDFSYTPTFTNNVINQTTGKVKLNVAGKYKVSFSSESVYYTSVTGYQPISFPTSNTIIVYVDGEAKYTYYWQQLVDVITNISFNTMIDIKAGQEVYFEMTFAGGCTIGSSTGLQSFSLSFSNTDIELVADKNAVLTDNSPVSIGSALPDIKCSDFLKGILNLFYAYMSDAIYDPVTNKSKIYIDSFINYYEDQSIYDEWTDKVDESQNITIQSNSLLEGNNYRYRFSEEKDYYNAQIKTITGLNYGEKSLPINTWLSGEVVFELPFNTYVPVKPPNKQFILPIIIDSSTSDTGIVTQKPYKGKGMLTYYNGLRSGVVNMFNCSDDNYLIKYDYPFIHHMRYRNGTDFVPQFDLHFASRDLTFDDLTSIPNEKNTFDVYHKKFVNEITSIDSKLVTLYLKLSYKDINELNFATLKMIEGVLYRLNTIKDFDSDAYGTTEVELLKYLG